MPRSETLSSTVGAATVKDYLRRKVIRHWWSRSTIYRGKSGGGKAADQRGCRSFVANGDELHANSTRNNFARYQPPMVAVIGKLDVQQLAAVYIRFYPLFSKRIKTGIPNGYFNDRLVQVIDILLATPQPTGPIALVRPNVLYVFADPALESRPAGQNC